MVPDMKATGRKIAAMEKVEAMAAKLISLAPCNAASIIDKPFSLSL